MQFIAFPPSVGLPHPGTKASRPAEHEVTGRGNINCANGFTMGNSGSAPISSPDSCIREYWLQKKSTVFWILSQSKYSLLENLTPAL